MPITLPDTRITSSRPKLGIAIPLANEEATIRELLRRILRHLQPHDQVYCVLDNMSKDHTRDLVSCAAGEDSRIILIWAPENRGVMDAYFRGYRAAFDGGCEWILEMDGGFSHLPEQIPQFIAGMETGFDYVGGSRFMTGGCHASPWTRIFISKAGSVLANWLLKTRMTDMTSGFECFTRNAMSQVLKHGVTSKANFFQTEIRYRMHQFNWMEVPITYRNRNYSVGRSSLLEAIRVLWALYRAKPGD